MSRSPQLPANIKLSVLSALIAFATSPFNPAIASTPIKHSLMHASSIDIDKMRHDDEFIETLGEYFASEKLDGIRAIWTGRELITRQGNPINAPAWFVAPLPKDMWLEGELWIAHQQFQQLSSIVRQKQPCNKEWQKVRLMVFDAPSLKTPFALRLQAIDEIIESIGMQHIQIAPQYEVSHYTELESLLDNLESQGGEGIMLHHKDSHYHPGKSQALIKIKPYQDAEAVIVGYEPGKGKYSGQMGAIWVVTPDNKRFKIGSGFSDQDRQAPPALGTIVQYRFNGYTDNGIPRFARFLRERSSPEA
ncbi:DNA ligase [Photobacterium rosenbergii]|uniref:DNA ligase n=1 Tax=Photobacterium rosenbergii TaxID=294936 RepID=UPI0021BD74C3|nr:DNA ligase [Photobacterium rosenbergii]